MFTQIDIPGLTSKLTDAKTVLVDMWRGERLLWLDLERAGMWNWDGKRQIKSEYTQSFLNTSTVNHITNELGVNHILATIGVEEANGNDKVGESIWALHTVLEHLKRTGAIKEYSIVLNINYWDTVLEPAKRLPNVIVVPWFLCMYQQHYTDMAPWDPEKQRVLYLPGKINKPHRIMPLLYMDQEGYLKKTVYSSKTSVLKGREDWFEDWYGDLYTAYLEYTSAMGITDIMDREAYVEYIGQRKFNKDVDNSHATSDKLGMTPLRLVSDKLVSSTNVELVSETWYNMVPHVTEKTFRPILQGRPFILIGSLTSKFIRDQLGFKLYQDLLDYRVDKAVRYGLKAHEQTLGWPTGPYEITYEDLIKDFARCTQSAFDLSHMCKNNPEILDKVNDIAIYNRKLADNIYLEFLDKLRNKHPGILPVLNKIWREQGPHIDELYETLPGNNQKIRQFYQDIHGDDPS